MGDELRESNRAHAPVSRVTFANVQLPALKASSPAIPVTNELLRDVSAAGEQYFNRLVAGAASEAVDTAFVDMIIDTSSPSNPSSGVTAVDAKHDLQVALLSVNSIGSARLYWICAVDVAKRASTLTDAIGLDAFPAMSATGGEMANLPALVSSGVPAGSLFLIDASGIAADGGPITTRHSQHTSLEMSDTPTHDAVTPTAASLVSMFQTNSTAFIANAVFGAQVLRNDAVAEITGIAWGGA